MDGSRFDDVLRTATLGHSRRAALGALAGGLLAALVPAVGEGNARKRKKKKGKGSSCAERCDGRCLPRCPDIMTRNPSTCQCDCPDDMNRCGQICVGADRCCPGEKSCGGGCIRERECCPLTERECPNSVCVPKDACCPFIEEACGAECCILPEQCCNGECGAVPGGVCTNDGWCPPLTGMPCCAGSVADCSDHPCCDISAGEFCCVTSLEPFFETTCCPGGPGQCARGGCCPIGTGWKGDCEACCTHGATGCSSCRGAVGGRG